MADTLFPLPQPPPPQRRTARLSPNGKPLGRPPGAKGRRSIDLARYIEATFAGMTPGQQAAQLAMVTPKDLRTAKADAAELNAWAWAHPEGAPGVIDLELPALTLAMAVKAAQLAQALGCNRRDAWLLLQKEREGLIPYIHQKQPTAEPVKKGQLPTMFVVSEADMAQAEAHAAAAGEDVDLLEDFSAPADQVAQPKSHDDD